MEPVTGVVRFLPRPPFKVVLIAASLGAWDPLCQLVAGLPDDFPLPVLLVQHRPARAETGRLTRLLQKHTRLPVRSVTDGMTADRPGLAVVPAGAAASLDGGGALRLRRHQGRDVADLLFRSATETLSPAIAVVLSGMLRDGTAGVRAIKSRGGIALAQDPETALAPGMPSSAIATGCVDFVLPPRTIPAALIALAMAPGGAELFRVPLPHWARLGSDRAWSGRSGAGGRDEPGTRHAAGAGVPE